MSRIEDYYTLYALQEHVDETGILLQDADLSSDYREAMQEFLTRTKIECERLNRAIHITFIKEGK